MISLYEFAERMNDMGYDGNLLLTRFKDMGLDMSRAVITGNGTIGEIPQFICDAINDADSNR